MKNIIQHKNHMKKAFNFSFVKQKHEITTLLYHFIELYKKFSPSYKTRET